MKVRWLRKQSNLFLGGKEWEVQQGVMPRWIFIEHRWKVKMKKSSKEMKSAKHVRVETIAGAFSTPLGALIRALLSHIGEDPNREGLVETPERVIKSYEELFSGYKFNDAQIAKTLKVFEDGACDEMVVLKGIEFSSFCEHHMLPFIGIAHVAYVPEGRIVGISKLARLVDIYAKRLQVQERLTTQITYALDRHLKPKGSACVIEAKHQCMSCRGVGKQNSVMITSSLTGVFKDEGTTRSEFFSLVRG